mgnify:CR=1 FL=1
MVCISEFSRTFKSFSAKKFCESNLSLSLTYAIPLCANCVISGVLSRDVNGTGHVPSPLFFHLRPVPSRKIPSLLHPWFYPHFKGRWKSRQRLQNNGMTEAIVCSLVMYCAAGITLLPGNMGT